MISVPAALSCTPDKAGVALRNVTGWVREGVDEREARGRAGKRPRRKLGRAKRVGSSVESGREGRGVCVGVYNVNIKPSGWGENSGNM